MVINPSTITLLQCPSNVLHGERLDFRFVEASRSALMLNLPRATYRCCRWKLAFLASHLVGQLQTTSKLAHIQVPENNERKPEEHDTKDTMLKEWGVAEFFTNSRSERTAEV